MIPAAANVIPPGFWVGAFVAFLVGSLVSFFIGLTLGRTEVQRGIRRAGKEVAQLVRVMVSTLETAHQASAALESLSAFQLSTAHRDLLAASKQRLLDSFSNIEEMTKQVSSEPQPIVEPTPDVEKITLEWKLSTTDTDNATGLPGKTALELNLSHLLDVCNSSETKAGLLLIKIDKYDQLQTRFGKNGAGQFLTSLISVVCKAIRDEDLVCQYNADTVTVLLPDVTEETGYKVAAAIRNSVRNHHFRLEAGSPEVLVTASFGFTLCHAGDNADLILNRAANALAKSRKRGRNQLHISSGSKLLYCGVS